jgi:hypothetical protein
MAGEPAERIQVKHGFILRFGENVYELIHVLRVFGGGMPHLVEEFYQYSKSNGREIVSLVPSEYQPGEDGTLRSQKIIVVTRPAQ